MKPGTKQMIKIVGGGILAIGGICLSGHGIYTRGRQDFIDEFTDTVYNRSEAFFELVDKTGMPFNIKAKFNY